MQVARVGRWLALKLAPRSNRAARRAGLAGDRGVDARWRTVTRVAGRACAIYSGLYCLTTPQVLLALVGGGLGHRQEVADAWARIWAVRPVRNWVAARVFGIELTKRFDGGDDHFAWVGRFCWLGTAVASATMWSALDRRRTNDSAWPWFDLAVRLCLAGQMFYYGAAKAVPLQFQLPLAKLVEPFGNFSPMSVLWSQSAYSEVYQRLLGCAEIAAGILLVAPKTATLGALLSAAEMGQVLLLNMTFDVPVKIHSSHLLLLSLVLLAPDSARLARFFLSDQSVQPSRRTELFRSRRANQIATALQIAGGMVLLGAQLRNDYQFWKNYGGGRERPALYGIWDVETFSINGQQFLPLTTDATRWRRFIVESADAIAIQRMDDSLDHYAAAIDADAVSITLITPSEPRSTVALTFQLLADDQLTLAGSRDGEQLILRLRRLDLNSLPLVNRGFRWVQESAYWK